jgi:hypothetical protein
MGLSSRPTTEQWTGCGELVTGGSWATVTVDPTTVVAGNKTGSATPHLADRGTWTRSSAGRGRIAVSSRCSRDGSDEGSDGSEDETHVFNVNV